MSDPFFKHKQLYFWGIVAIVLSFCLLGFALYLLPYLFLGLKYSVPSFITDWSQWYQFYYHFSGFRLSLLLVFPFLFSGAVFFVLARVIDIYLEKEAERLESVHGTRPDPQTVVVLIKVVLLLVIVLAVIYFFS